MDNINETILELLRSWDLDEAIIEDFLAKGIDIEVLKELTVEDINTLIPEQKFGARIKFRKQLFLWKEQNGYYRPAASTPHKSVLTATEEWLDSLPLIIQTATKENEGDAPQSLNLFTTLSNTITGQILIKNYELRKVLSNNDRSVLAHAIADFWVSLDRKITEKDYERAVAQIKILFPTESEDIYMNKRNQRGKLAEKYYSLCKKYRKAGLQQSRYNKCKKLEDQDTLSVTSSLLENEIEDVHSHYQWLKLNNSPYQLVVEKWIITYELRKKHISSTNIDLFEEWPILKQSFATELIELDFEKQYPSKNLMLFSKWDAFCEKITTIYQRDLKDTKCKFLLKSLHNISNEDYKNYTISILLNGILIPQIIKSNKSLKKCYKPSILDAQKSFALHVTEKRYIHEEIQNRKLEFRRQNWSIQPTIIVVGTEELSEYYVYMNDIIYHMDSFLKALSVSFQLHQVLNLEYGKECRQVWNFIEEYFYDIPSTNKQSTALIALLGELKQ